MVRAVATVVSAVLLAGCGSPVEGEPVAGPPATPTSSAPETSAPSSSGAVPDPDMPGVVPTTAAPAGGTCEPRNPPPVGVVAAVDDPRAPTITVALPEGWSTTAGEGDVGARLTGPGEVTATVTITETALDPAAAFEKHADDAMGQASVSSISVLPGTLCGFSGQKLIGSWAESPEQAVTFGDRIAHIPSGSTAFLVAVHVEGPTHTSGFDPFASPLLDDFAVVLP